MQQMFAGALIAILSFLISAPLMFALAAQREKRKHQQTSTEHQRWYLEKMLEARVIAYPKLFHIVSNLVSKTDDGQMVLYVLDNARLSITEWDNRFGDFLSGRSARIVDDLLKYLDSIIDFNDAASFNFKMAEPLFLHTFESKLATVKESLELDLART